MLIEVLVSALVIAIVAGAVMGLIQRYDPLGGDPARATRVAYALAQEDQARLRSMRISSLNRLEQGKPVDARRHRYTVRSHGVFVSNATGSVCCTGEISPPTTSGSPRRELAGDWQKPIVLTSIVAPSNGSLDPTHGTLSVNAMNAAGRPLPASASRRSGTGTFSGTTDSTGCANFADLPPATTPSRPRPAGMINMKGETSTTNERRSPCQRKPARPLIYDQAGVLRTGIRLPGRQHHAPSCPPESTRSSSTTAKRGSSAKPYGTPGSTRSDGSAPAPLFPFKAKYTVYGGGCETNNPDPEEKVPANRPRWPSSMCRPAAPPNRRSSCQRSNLTVTNNGTADQRRPVTITDTNVAAIPRQR